MLRWVKRVVKRALRRFDYHIHHIPPGKVAGNDFRDDIRLLVGKGNPVCFDVGANVGQTIRYLREIFDQPRIYAFEPSAASFSILKSTFPGDAVSIHNIALGSRNTHQDLITFASSDMNSFLPIADRDGNQFRGLATCGRENVEVMTLDDFVASRVIRTIDLLKIDTQGYDLQVLMGATKSLESGMVRAVFVEFIFAPMYTQQCSPHEIIEFLGRFNYRLVDLYEKVRANHELAWCNALFARL